MAPSLEDASATMVAGYADPQERPPFLLLLVGIASHKLARLLPKDKVTGPLRAPSPN